MIEIGGSHVQENRSRRNWNRSNRSDATPWNGVPAAHAATSTDCGTELSGVIATLTTNSITVNQINIDISQAEIKGQLAVGATVNVDGTLLADGSITACEVKSSQKLAGTQEPELTGTETPEMEATDLPELRTPEPTEMRTPEVEPTKNPNNTSGGKGGNNGNGNNNDGGKGK